MPDILPATAPAIRVAADDAADSVRVAGGHLDQVVRAAIARSAAGLSVAALGEACVDWTMHVAVSPGKQAWLAWKGMRKTLRLAAYLIACAQQGGTAEPCIEPLPTDRRFVDPAWQTWPFNFYYQNFLSWQQWVHNATTDVRGVSAAHEHIVAFTARQILDTLAPSNFLPTNPVAIERTVREGGFNLLRGFELMLRDMERAWKRPSAVPNPAVGRTVAVTPGKIVFRNRLFELIQYAPATPTVAPEPVLIVPAWIMKYYILDLSPANSLVHYMVERGFTVFMISWRNPDSSDRDLGMDDYLARGVMAAIDAVCAITQQTSVHAAGYCLGGTLLSIAAAAMARDGDARLRSVSLFAAQQDFTDAGELTLFINDSQIALLEDMMWERGYLDARQMAGAFQLLRPNDLIWSRVVRQYMLGESLPETDLMEWNADATRMPARMHAEYLRSLFLNDDLAEGHYRVDGRPVRVGDIQVPIFAVGTRTDHIAPWQSVYKVHLLTNTEVTFVLTTGGHNAGIVSEPGHRGRSFQILVRPHDGTYLGPDAWLAQARSVAGSWWPAWADWLAARSGTPCAPPPLGRPEDGYPPLMDAPGEYVLQP